MVSNKTHMTTSKPPIIEHVNTFYMKIELGVENISVPFFTLCLNAFPYHSPYGILMHSNYDSNVL